MTLSIITATYNAAAHLQHCLASLSVQTVPFEHIIIDGASTDGTLSIIEEYIAERSRIPNPESLIPTPESLIPKFVSEPDRGLYDALNKGIRMATGEIIGILHADDFYPSPDILAKVAAVFENPDVEACYGDLLYVRASEESATRVSNFVNPESRIPNPGFKIVRYWHSGSYNPQKFYHGWMPPHPTLFVRREVYEKHGLFRLDLGTAADYELMLRFLLKHRIRCAYLPEVLVNMRVGGASNRSISARLKANRMDRQAWMINGLQPYPWTILFKPLRKIPQYFIR